MALHVILDSTAGVTEDFSKKYDKLHIVPLQVILGEQQYDECEIKLTQLFEFVQKTKKHPKTSQPSIGAFIETMQPIIDAGDEVIIITIAEALSGTVNGARSALKYLGASDRIHIIDSNTTSVAMLKMTETAFELSEKGFTTEDITTRLRLMAKLTKTIFVPDTLEYLHKGGRIGKAATLVGTILNVKPLLHLLDGKVHVLAKIRTKHKAIMGLLEELPKEYPMEYIAVLHVEAKGDALAIAKRLEKEYCKTNIEIHELGAVLASHLGQGVLGIICQEKII